MGGNIRENFCIYKQYNTFPNDRPQSLCSSVVWGLYIDDIVHGLDQESVSIMGAVDEGMDDVAYALDEASSRLFFGVLVLSSLLDFRLLVSQ